MLTLSLEEPSAALAPSFEALRDACARSGDEGMRQWTREKRPADWVPEHRYWVVARGEVVGEVEIRERLNEWLQQVGGHIGYITHPDHRNRGIATFALREGLRLLTRFGVKEALVTVREENAASIRVIEKCGGVRVEDSKADGPKRRRYVIACPTEQAG